MFRYFCSDDNIISNKINVTGSDVRHLKTILRAQAGDLISVVTDSNEYKAKIEVINKDDIICQIIEEVY